jgi:hypothetical protein
MADGTANALTQMPPWAWGLLLLGSGGGIGTLSGLSLEGHENCAERSTLLKLETDLQSARNGLEGANTTIQSLIEVIKQNKSSNDGWIE